jgi:glycerol-3-phosphate acyltransferase PlsY
MTVLLLLLCYAIGSTAFGWAICKIFFSFDVRDYGSRNFGGTNVIRVLREKRSLKTALWVGLAVILLDAFKGFLIFWLVPWLMDGDVSQLVWYAAGLAAILGHNFSFWFWGKGGKGVATSAGVLAVFMPLEVIIALVIWALIVLISKYVSLGSIVAAIAVFVTHFIKTSEWFASLENPFTAQEWSLTILTLIITVAVIYTHRQNISRILKGQENKISLKKSTV